ncbi:hypothetical protein [Lactiplantibacillus carotarum]|uniref:hypothetical protein n=1 Tax=Lactiplantibacillus carotarum TaxID=2993456 RepID=UPI00298F1F1B|nr:hypothetical protein [Lactiplantibacillus carotarum]
MQDLTLNDISFLVFLFSLVAIITSGLAGFFVIRQYHTDTSFWQYKKYKKIRAQFLNEPIHGNYQLTVMARLRKFSVLILILMGSGQVLMYQDTPFLAVAIVSIASLVTWLCSNHLRRYRRTYWKTTPTREFELVSDRRFKISQFLIANILFSLIILSISFSVFLNTQLI